MVQPSSAAWANSHAFADTDSRGKSSKAVTHFGLALHGRMHRSPKKATVLSAPRMITAW